MIEQSKELEEKQLLDVITDIYQELNEEDEVLSAPDGDRGIFKYIGTSPEAKFYLSKMSRKRDVKRAGLGFVIQRAELSDRIRISLDIEITDDVTGKDPRKIVESMNAHAQYEYGVKAPEFIVYFQPAHSGKRGWETKTFMGIEMDLTDRDFNALNKMRKRILTIIRKLFQSIDYALTEN